MLTGQKGKEAVGNVQRVFVLYISVNESFHHLKNVPVCHFIWSSSKAFLFCM
jgi:hypothetical protein